MNSQIFKCHGIELLKFHLETAFEIIKISAHKNTHKPCNQTGPSICELWSMQSHNEIKEENDTDRWSLI